MAKMILPLVWAVCAIAGYLYSRLQGIPIEITLAVLPAFLLEATFFTVLAMENWRARLEKLPPTALAIGLTLAAIAPYSLSSWALGRFEWLAVLAIGSLAAAASFWYVVLPPERKGCDAPLHSMQGSDRAALRFARVNGNPASDLLFLLFMAVVWLARFFHELYLNPHPRVPLEALGQLMWFRTGLFAMVSIRRIKGVGFGFWPKRSEWKIGAWHYLSFLPVAVAMAWAVGFAKPRVPSAGWEKTSFLVVATFFGVLWVLALGEEFFFRGLLQQWMTAWFHSEWAGLVLASVVFGSAHLWYHAFPNWRFAVMAATAGIFYGLAFRQARSIRASMVTHALVVTSWRIFFS